MAAASAGEAGRDTRCGDGCCARAAIASVDAIDDEDDDDDDDDECCCW